VLRACYHYVPERPELRASAEQVEALEREGRFREAEVACRQDVRVLPPRARVTSRRYPSLLDLHGCTLPMGRVATRVWLGDLIAFPRKLPAMMTIVTGIGASRAGGAPRLQAVIQHMLWHELAVPLHADDGQVAGRPGTLVVDKQLLVSWRDEMKASFAGKDSSFPHVARVS